MSADQLRYAGPLQELAAWMFVGQAQPMIILAALILAGQVGIARLLVAQLPAVLDVSMRLQHPTCRRTLLKWVGVCRAALVHGLPPS